MNEKKSIIKIIMTLIGIGALVFAIICTGISLTKNLGKSSKAVTAQEAREKLDDLYSDITVNKVQARKEPIKLETPSLADSLPDISKYPAQVDSSTADYVEIFASTEKTGEGKDGFLVDAAKDFNASKVQVDGKTVSVRIRGIASGTGMDYIVSKKYMPDAFTPSNELWGEMMRSQGVNLKLIEKKLAGNVAGIIVSKDKYNELVKKYGSINLKNITDAVANNKIAMGYTNPFSSSTGLNFLVSALNTFDSKSLLSEKAVEGFEKFQKNIPFVAYTTLQMRNSADSGVLDGFIMEYQTYVNDSELKSNYVFTPFGVRHDNPVYEIGTLTPQKDAILKKFIAFCKTSKYQKLASDYGFNKLDNYKSEIGYISGDVITRAQKLWKEKKNVNSNIAAVFVADVSGSMDGSPLNRLKESLLKASQYIGKENSIGLVTFSTDVSINLPISKFDLNQRSLFTGAVDDMQASGNTAMYDGIITAMKMLEKEKAKNSNAKLMLFVLTDGDNNVGHEMEEVKDVIKTLKIPIYTIGYNANIKSLEDLSDLNEAASINADSEDVIYKLENLFNAQM